MEWPVFLNRSCRGGFFLSMACCLGLTLQMVWVRPAHAMSSNVKAVLVTSAYGIVGGTALGVVGFAFSQNLRTIFMGSSIGLYLGVAVGIYLITDRHNPQSPLHQRPSDAPPWKQPGLPPVEGDRIYYDLNSQKLPKPSDRAWVSMQWPVYTF